MDIYLHRHPDGRLSQSLGGVTFGAFYREIDKKVHTGIYDEYHEINGYLLGNVYTQYYPYHVDFGSIGVFIMVMVLSSMSMYAYNRGIRNFKRPLELNPYILIYAFMAMSFFMAFFSSKLTENFSRPGFLRTTIYIISCVDF